MCPSREDKGISPSLETTDKRSRALGFSRRLPNSSSNRTSSGEGSKNTKFKSGTTKTSTSGSKGNAGKGLHFKSLSLKRRIFEQFVSDQQKRWRELTSHKFEGYESVYSLKTLQDGGFAALSEVCVAERGLHVQSKPGCNLNFETSDGKGHNLSRRFTDFENQYERNIYSKGLCDLPIATSRLCDKSEKVCVRSCTRNRVLRVDRELLNYDFVITRGKDQEDKGSMPEVIQGIRGITSGFDKANRNTFFNHSSSATSSSTVSLLTTTTHSISKTNTVLPDYG